jgi:hypothetical protein
MENQDEYGGTSSGIWKKFIILVSLKHAHLPHPIRLDKKIKLDLGSSGLKWCYFNMHFIGSS